MIRTSRRTAGMSRAVVAALAAVGATLLAGCQAGQQAATAEQRPTIDGNFAQVGNLALRDVKIEHPASGSWPQGGDARIELIVVNEGVETDALVAVRTDAAGGAELSTTPGGAAPTVTVTPQPSPAESESPSGSPSESPSESESGTSSPSGSGSPSPTVEPIPTEEPETSIPIPGASLISMRDEGPEVLLTGLTRPLRSGQVVPITFVFQLAGEVTVNVAVAIPMEEIPPAPTVPAEGEAEAGAEE